MSTHIKKPTRVKSAGNKVKIIDEFIGRVNTGNNNISIARMQSPAGWIEPPQKPEFDEYTFVIKGYVEVLSEGKRYKIEADQVYVAKKGVKVQYSTPGPDGAEYVAICTPAFNPDTVHRED